MTTYNPLRFASTYENEGGCEIWEFLTNRDNIIRMETACYLSRPAAEPLSPYLIERFGNRIAEDRIKQMTGHMIRQILEGRGYQVDRGNVRISRDGNIFTSATRYIAA